MNTNHRLAAATGTLLILVATSVTAAAQSTTRVSVDSSGAEGNGTSYISFDQGASISADRHYVAFCSNASNLVSGDLNGSYDVFVHDCMTGATVCVSVDSAGQAANSGSGSAALSADGRFVTFLSGATDLVTGDTNARNDVFLHDRDPDANGIFDEGNGVTTRVSVDSNGVQANDHSFCPAISADGSTVASYSYADNLVRVDGNAAADVFVHDRLTGKTLRMSLSSSGAGGNNGSYYPSLSADGKLVAFGSFADNLVAGDTNGWYDIFVRDRTTGLTTRVSVDSSGAEGDGWSGSYPTISADGRVVAFGSGADNLVAGDTNGVWDVFAHDRTTGTTERVSVDSTGAEADADSDTTCRALSADGRFVAFISNATNLVAGDTNGLQDAFVHDRTTGATTRVNVDSAGAESSGTIYGPGISADGEVVGFSSDASSLVSGDTNGLMDVFVRNRCVAIASSYGAGWPGTLGTPTIVASADPVLGSNLTITISNSLGVDTPGLLLIGLAEASFPTGKGGALLVNPLLFNALLIHAAGEGLSGSIPIDPTLCEVEVDLQALEIDAGASKGMSFTAGLKLLLGY